MGISLAAARVNAKLSQSALAEILDVTPATVRNWENGRVKIPAIHLRRLAELSGVRESDIFLPEPTTKNSREDDGPKEG